MINISENDKILIVRLTALGDCIHTLPLACAIKKAFPNIHLGWAVSEKCKDIIVDNPVIDKAYVFPKNDSKKYADIMGEIRQEKYTIAIDSQELFKSAIISFSSNAKYRLAHDNSREFSHIFANQKLKAIPLFDTTRHVIERNMDFARFLGIKADEINYLLPKNKKSDEEYINQLLHNDFKFGKKTIVISPATTWITKFWTKENWAAVIKEISPHLNVVITGGMADKTYVDDILALAGDASVVDLTGKTNILQLKIVFENADMVLTPDSGSAHLAVATQKPTVICLCGATSPVRNGAYGEQHINISDNLNCQYCYKKTCKLIEGIPYCMQNISPEVVIEKIKSVLRR